MACHGGAKPHVCIDTHTNITCHVVTTYYNHTDSGRTEIETVMTKVCDDEEEGGSGGGDGGGDGGGSGGGGGGNAGGESGIDKGPGGPPPPVFPNDPYEDGDDGGGDDSGDDGGGGSSEDDSIVTWEDDLGWTGGARSFEEIPAGVSVEVSFKIPDPAPGVRPTGVAVGFAKPRDVPTRYRNGYDHLYCGLVFIGDEVGLVLNGEETGSIPYADVTRYGRVGEYEDVYVSVYDDAITWYVNGELTLTAPRLRAALVFDATLYSSDSSIDDPLFRPYQYAALSGEIPALVAQSEPSLVGDLPPLGMLGAEQADFGALAASVPALTMDALVTRLDPRAKYAKLEGTLPPLLGRIRDTAQKAPKGLTPALPGLNFLAGDDMGYAELVGKLPRLNVHGLVMNPPAYAVAMETVASRAWLIEQPVVTIFLNEGLRIGSGAEIAAVVTWAHAEETIQACCEHSLVATALNQIIEQAVLGGKVTLRVMLTPDEHAPPGALPVAADFSQGWAVVEGAQATTRYDNYGFNSFAVVNGAQFGAKADGIYLLDGTTDGGRPITSGVALGTHDFGTQALKHLPAVYAGVSSAGRLYLKVSDGTNAYTYRARRSDEFMRVQRFDVGKGLRASYFSFELTGEGDAFELDTVQFMAVPTQRRI